MKSLLAFLAALASDAPHLLGPAVKLVNDISTGEGGLGKIENVAGDLAAVAAEVAPIAVGPAAPIVEAVAAVTSEAVQAVTAANNGGVAANGG
ncbi:MAG TPA: hypothetical protein VGL83_08105 [Stellaceae bacterium]|jgi:hypothetical protein